jgi:hypothetical protein
MDTGLAPLTSRERRDQAIAEVLARLRARSCVIDGEAVCCGDNGMSGCGIAASARDRFWHSRT